ncbi:hypothetical protein L873DRAFT_1789733 [Choiromyces venosus 120613-1]|uniref:Uncharacterized protein n=1 Tax=Choiromyces venosus 120613-1 TaxID=1336337 RepID=A0A3N4JMC8_9PEZI|nr:hypothetical protein L873DRAFT_1789733 [Choiromyces venosus 120613-1]
MDALWHFWLSLVSKVLPLTRQRGSKTTNGSIVTSRSMLVHFLRALQFYSERNSGEARAGRSIYDASCARTGRTAKKNKAGFGGCTLSGRIVKRSGDGSAKKSGRGKEESWREGGCEHKKWQASRVEIENTGEGEIGGLADLMGGLGITGEKMDGLVDLMGGLGITGEKTDGMMDGLEFIREDGEEEIA